MRIVNVCGHSFAPELIRKGDIVLDCGAHRGHFSRWCTANLACRVFSFEPDPRLHATLAGLEEVEFIDRAVTSSEQPIALALGVKSCSSAFYRTSRQEVVEVPTVILDRFCADRGLDGPISLIKVDIEGSELDVLDHLPKTFLDRTRQITVEFHDFLSADDLPRIRPVAARLRNHGFHMVRFTHYTWGDCLFINDRVTPLGLLTRLKLHLYDKYLIGIVRSIRRRLVGARGVTPSSTRDGPC